MACQCAQLGYFAYGGSTCILILPKKLYKFDNVSEPLPTWHKTLSFSVLIASGIFRIF